MKSFISIILSLTLSTQALATNKVIKVSTVEKQVTHLLECVQTNNDVCQNALFEAIISTLEDGADQGINSFKLEESISKLIDEARSTGQYDNRLLNQYQEHFTYFFKTNIVSAEDLNYRINDFVSCLKDKDTSCKYSSIKNLAKALVEADQANVPRDELANIVAKATSDNIEKGEVDMEKLQEFSDQLDEELKEQYTSLGRDAAAYAVGAAVGAIVIAFVVVNTIGVLSRITKGTKYSRKFDRDHNLGYGGIGLVAAVLSGLLVTGPLAIELSDSMSNSMKLMLKDDLRDIL